MQTLFFERLAGAGGSCDDGKIHQAGLQGVNGLRIGIVGDPDPDLRVIDSVLAQCGQQEAEQRGLGRSDRDDAALQLQILTELIFSGLQLFAGDGDIFIQFRTLRSQCDSAVGADKERTAKLRFQILDGAGQVGLVTHENIGRLSKVAVFCDKIENPVIIVTD